VLAPVGHAVLIDITYYKLIQIGVRNGCGLVASFCLRRIHPSREHLRYAPNLGCLVRRLVVSLADWKSTVYLAKGDYGFHDYALGDKSFRARHTGLSVAPRKLVMLLKER